jgi:polynucleotide 5'-hydroxyl-kinase GRC3/NOL9
MSPDWADKTAQQILSKDLIKKGICLILGASDTGKTTLAAAFSEHSVSNQPVGIIDADIGQSHIGPPTTVGWALVDNPKVDFSKLTAGGISFVGNITPIGHLLQLTSAITQCVQQISKLAELIVIDTPGLVYGPAASALWWTVQQLLKPELILAVQRNDELSNILDGLRFFDSAIELIKSPPQMRVKSPEERKRYRQNQFNEYFRDSFLCNIRLSDVSIQSDRSLSRENLAGRLVGLKDVKGIDLAVGIIEDWQNDKGVAIIRAPKLDIRQICCLVIGNAVIDLPDR